MTHINQRRDLSTNWASANPVLQLGEVGWETDTRRSKLGDGATAWNDLLYTVSTLSITKADIGLGNVDNTSDMDKPVSTATSAALAVLDGLKADIDSPAFTGTPTAPTPTLGDDDTSIATTEFVQDAIAAAITAAKLVMHPVGSLYFTVVNTNPGTYLGGTWAAWGAGRVPVGVDTGQIEFDTVEETGGAKTHTLTAAELPNTVMLSTDSGQPGRADSINMLSRGGGGAHNNLQPYITCYMWKRTA